MKQTAKPCAQCTPDCQTELAVSAQAAFFRYAELVKQGLSPSICQQQSGVFHICHVGKQECASSQRCVLT